MPGPAGRHLKVFQSAVLLKEVQVKPYYGKLLLVLVLGTEDMPSGAERPHYVRVAQIGWAALACPSDAGIDFGTDNIAAIVSTDHTFRIYKGGVVLSANLPQTASSTKKAEAAGILTKGKRHKHADSARLRRLCLRYDCFVKDMMG